jgi:H+/gluconate symporter-like permease
MFLVFCTGRVRVLCKKHDFLIMDMLVTAVAIALLCLAAWLLYKRFSSRFKAQPDDQEDEEEYEEDDTPDVQEATDNPTPPPAPEPKKEV